MGQWWSVSLGRHSCFFAEHTTATLLGLPDWEQDREIMEGKILPQGSGRPCPSGWGDGHLPTAGGRQAAHLQAEDSAAQRLRLPKYSATACIQQISTEHHHYLMRLWSMKILFWAVSHKTILLVQPFISLSSLKLDTWDPNQQNIFYMCMEFRQSFRYKIYAFFSLSLGPSQFTQLVTVLEHLGRQWKNSEKKSLFWEHSVSRHFWTSFNKELL